MPKTLFCISVCEHTSGLYLSGSDCQKSTSILHFSPDSEIFRLLRMDILFRRATLLSCLREELYYIKLGTMEVTNLSEGPSRVNFTVKLISLISGMDGIGLAA